MEEMKNLTQEELQALEDVNKKIVYEMMVNSNYIPQKEKYMENTSIEEDLDALSRSFTVIKYNRYNSTEDVIKAARCIIENDLRLDNYCCAAKMTELIAKGVDLVEYKDIINNNPTIQLNALLKLIEAKAEGLNIDKYLEAMQKHENAFSAYCVENLIKLQENGFNMDQFLNDNCFVDKELHETYSTYSISGSILNFFLERKDDISKLSPDSTEILVPDKLLDIAKYATQTTDRAGYGISNYIFKASMHIHNQLNQPVTEFEQQSQLYQQSELKGYIDLDMLQRKITDAISDGSFEFEYNHQKYSITQIPASDLCEVKSENSEYSKYIYNKETKELTDTSKNNFANNHTIDSIKNIIENEDPSIL